MQCHFLCSSSTVYLHLVRFTALCILCPPEPLLFPSYPTLDKFSVIVRFFRIVRYCSTLRVALHFYRLLNHLSDPFAFVVCSIRLPTHVITIILRANRYFGFLTLPSLVIVFLILCLHALLRKVTRMIYDEMTDAQIPTSASKMRAVVISII